MIHICLITNDVVKKQRMIEIVSSISNTTNKSWGKIMMGKKPQSSKPQRPLKPVEERAAPPPNSRFPTPPPPKKSK